MDDYEYERKQRREREKSERQQVQTSSSSNREVALFSEPRRVNPSEADDDISAKLGEYSTVKDFINLYTVGISNSGHRQMPPNAILPGIVPTSPSVPVIGASSSLSSSVTSSSQRLPPPPSQQSAQSQQSQQQPPHHYQQHQQQLRQAPYVKQADNKPPYNGRGGYPGQPVNRSSSGMAPPKGPPVVGSGSASSTSGSLLPPSTTHMPNGRPTSASTNEKSYLGPPVSASSLTTQQHNGRFSQPSIPKQRQKPFPQDESDITEILNCVTSTFRPPKMLTGIDATPHNTLIENYNLSEPNKHKYSFDISAKVSMIEPLLDSPPRNDMPAPRFVPPLLSATPSATTQMPSTQSASSLSSVSASISSSSSSAATSSSCSSMSTSQSSLTSSSRRTYIAPLQPAATNATIASSSIANNNNSSNATTASTSSGQSSSTLSTAITSSPTVPLSPLMGRPTKDAGFLKPMKSEKPTPPPLDRQNSTLENDLELSESDDDRVKQSCSAVNTSDSSPSDSSESGSESSKSESNQPALNSAHLHLQQQQMAAAMASKKKLGPGSATGGSCSSSGLGSSAPPSGGSSSSSSNKTPSPSNTTKWQLSRYFNKAPLHQTPTQDVSPSAASAVVNSVNSMNSMNMANINMPITLRGGAQIIPEPPQQLTNIKNESVLDDQDDNDGEADEGDQRDEDNDKINSGEKKSNLRRSSKAKKDGSKSAADTFPHPGLAAASAAFPSRKTPASLSVTPLSPMLTDIKKEAATPHPSLQSVVGSNQQQLPDFLSMNTNQIKHETMVIAGGHTTVTPYDVLQGFSNLSSDSNSSDEGNRERLPVRGPGGTLQIPGVPAAITALPRSPPIMQKAPIPNTLTMIPIDPLPSSPPSVSTRPLPTVQQQTSQARPRKPRKKLKQAQSAALAPDTSDEEQDDISKQQRLVPPITAAVVSGLAIAGGTKKGRGRPRKTTPNQSGNMSSNSSASASAKGPSLTAKKDISKKPPASSITPTKANNKKRMSRQNSSNSLAQETMSTTQSKQLYAAAATTTTQLTAPTQPLEALFTAATSDDSSTSSDSSSYSISKTSSTSDTEIERPNNKNNNKSPLKTITFSSDDDEDAVPSKQKSVQNQKNGEAKTLTTTAPKRIVKKLNTRKSSLEDLSTASSTTKPTNICLSSTSSSESSAEDFSHPSAAQASSASLAAHQTANATTTMSGSGSSSQRSVNHQSPYKSSGPMSNRSRKPTSCSSAFSSESSGEYHSDSDSGRARNEKKLKRDKPKSDKNKISTLTRIFKTSNEGGAKKQGQVMIVDQSEDQQQQQQQQQQKHISPALRSSQENLTTLHSALQNATATSQSPRLTPGGHMRSPRSFPMPPLATQVLAAGALMTATSHRTPDRSTTSAERKLQQRIKTPTRTPTRTPPTTRTPTPTPAAVAAASVNAPAASRTPTSSSLQPPLPTSLVCKIDLSRLLHIPAEWHANNYRLHGTHHFGYASAGRTPIYDHETILHADLQSCNTQMRLKSTKNGGSGCRTPRKTANRQSPMQTTSSISAASERELSNSRESLNEMTKENGNSGRLSSRSTDGSIGGGGSTPKDFSSHVVPPPPGGGPPNGYSSAAGMARGYGSPSGKASGGGKLGLTGVKHEQIIKHEPDAEYSNDTKYKSDTSSTADPSLVKQELLILKQDYKPSDLANITEKSSALCSPNDMQLDAKPRRKRSTSSSSSPFKEKRRKKEKDMVPPPMVTIEKDKMSGGGYLTGGAKDKDVVMDILKPSKDIMDDKVVHSNGQAQDHHMLVDQQYAPTNHDRLLPEKQQQHQQQQQQQQIDKSYNNNNNSNNTNNNSTSNVSNTASPAHLQTNCSSNVTPGPDMMLTTTKGLSNATMPPPSNVGLLTTLTTTPASVCTKSPHTTILALNTNNTTSNTNSMYNNNNNNSNTTSSFTASTATLSVSSSATASPVNNAIITTTTTTTASHQPIPQQQQQQLLPPPSLPPPPQVIYRSYFERDDDALNDEFSKDAKFLQEAIHRKHAADREQNTFNQVALYLEAVVYFLLTGAAMEQHSRSEDAAWTMYKDTLSLIKHISSKFRHLQMSSANQHETHNKVAILSLRCQSLISLKLYKLKRLFCRQINATCTEFFRSGKGDIINGNTPSSISPSNSVGSQGSGSNTPPGKIVPQDIHSALHQQNQFFNYLASSHELWEQADRLVRQGNHTDFFIALDHENGPLTLHSNVYEVFRYVQAGLKKLKDEMLIQ